MARIILASGSPRRQELLQRIGLREFEISVPDVEEWYPPELVPEDIVAYISREKSQAVPSEADEIVITVTGPDEEFVRWSCVQLRDSIRAAAAQPPYCDKIESVLGPAPAAVVKLNERYRYRITLRGRCTGPVRELLSAYMRAFAQKSENKSMHIFTECNRMN